jgi:predicted alpha-1,2-mannosidase
MKLRKFILYLSILILCPSLALSCIKDDVTENLEPVDLVNVFIDTHNSRWFYFNSASRPFGMVNLSPDTETHNDWGGGYLYNSKFIRCFSHIHGWQLSGIPVLPATGEPKGHLGMDAYKSSFSHENEVARPGYHKVYLEDYGIQAELTSTTRVGFHRYRFENQESPHVIFDLGAFLAFGQATDVYMEMSADTLLEGFVVMAGNFRRPKPIKIFFTSSFDTPILKLEGWRDSIPEENPIKIIQGSGTGAHVRFPEGLHELKMKIAISYTSLENARLNMASELSHWDFDRVVKDSYSEWNQMLQRIRIKGGTRKQRVKFYTDLWHALLGRRIVSDVNGDYIDNTGKVPVVRKVPFEKGQPKFPHYNFDALWGSHWSLNTLWSLAYPEIMDGFANTMVDIYSNGGLIPRGPSGGNYTYVMVGDPASSFFSAAYHKGIRNYDVKKAYEGLRKNAFAGGIRDRAGYEHVDNPVGGGMSFYLNQGWIPENIPVNHRAFHKAGAAMTLEYAYQDWCLSQLAYSLGYHDDYMLFSQRAYNYKKLWNPSTGFMHPREKNGTWIHNFTPVAEASHTLGFIESNAAIYTHFVPHDISGLTILFGGAKTYADTLDAYFERSKGASFVGPSKKTHAANWVNYGNQPSTGMAHIFNHAGFPWLSQKWVRSLKESLNDTTAYGGYNGDEDQGQMGALGVLMAIGLFSMDGGAAVNPGYEITSPIFDRIEIELNDFYYPGQNFVIETKNNGPKNYYIRSARLNGEKWNQCWLYHADIINGGKLVLDLGPSPNKAWGISELPPSMTRNTLITK